MEKIKIEQFAKILYKNYNCQATIKAIRCGKMRPSPKITDKMFLEDGLSPKFWVGWSGIKNCDFIIKNNSTTTKNSEQELRSKKKCA